MEVASHAYSLGSLMVDWLDQVKKLVQVWHLAQYVHETHKTALTEEVTARQASTTLLSQLNPRPITHATMTNL